jgi:hypothetical protein
MAPRGSDHQRQTWCPSGDPNLPESVVLGVQSHEHRQVAYLAEPIAAADALAMVPEGVPATRILRFASHCASTCLNRDGEECALITRLLAIPRRAPEDLAVPRCHLRLVCKWWDQVGVEACHRCPAVTTAHLASDDFGELAANPATTREDLDAWIAADPTATLAIGT